MPCPAKLPHDLEKGMHSNRMAQWFGPPFKVSLARLARQLTPTELASHTPARGSHGRGQALTPVCASKMSSVKTCVDTDARSCRAPARTASASIPQGKAPAVAFLFLEVLFLEPKSGTPSFLGLSGAHAGRDDAAAVVRRRGGGTGAPPGRLAAR